VDSTPSISQIPVATPQCEHIFHEHCLTEWFSPISYPSMEHNLGPVATALEDRSIIIDLVSQLPRRCDVRTIPVDMTTKGHAHHLDEYLKMAVQYLSIQITNSTEKNSRPTDRDRFTQSLPSVNAFTEDFFTREVTVFDFRVAADRPSPTCPDCRQPAGLGQLNE
ncbi:MAG: hypothetical protein Q9204_003507, partial [Flavoplaca sp. TL-2023a]